MSQSKMSVLVAVFALVVSPSLAQSSFPDCPGVVNIDASTSVCCVGGTLSLADVNPSTCPGWPICTGPGTVTSTSAPEDSPITCAAVVDINDPNYSSLIASATSSIEASGTSAVTTIDPTASPGGSSSGGSAVTATSTSSQASGSASGTGSSSASSSSHTNGAVATGMSGTALGGMALACAIGAAGAFL